MGLQIHQDLRQIAGVVTGIHLADHVGANPGWRGQYPKEIRPNHRREACEVAGCFAARGYPSGRCFWKTMERRT
jgi:hypothetical protein